MVVQKKISLLTVFWGDWHTAAFLRYCVPSLLSRYNLPALAQRCATRMIIATNRGNEGTLWRNTGMQRLANVTDVEFAWFSDEELANLNTVDAEGKSATDDTFAGVAKRTRFLVSQQNRVLQRGFEDGFGVAYIHPDCIYANPTFDTIGRLANAGYDIVYAPGFRTTFEFFSSSELGGRFRPCESKNDPLVKATFDHLHEYHKYQFWDAEIVGHYPSIKFWRESKNLIVAREFHEKVPLYVAERFSGISIQHGIDAEFDAGLFARSVKERGSSRWVKYIDDSRDGFVCSLARVDYDLLRRWSLYGSLDDAETSKPPPPPLGRAASYLKAFAMFCEPLRLFSASHLIRIRLRPSARLMPRGSLYHAAHFRYYRSYNRPSKTAELFRACAEFPGRALRAVARRVRSVLRRG